MISVPIFCVFGDYDKMEVKERMEKGLRLYSPPSSNSGKRTKSANRNRLRLRFSTTFSERV